MPVVKISQKSFKPVVAMSNEFPFTTEDLLNILQFIAPFKVSSPVLTTLLGVRLLRLSSGFPNLPKHNLR